MRVRGGGSRRGQRGAGGSALPPPDSLPRKPEKVLHRVLCQAPRRHRAAGHPPSPSDSHRGRPGTRGTSPALPAYLRAPPSPAAATPEPGRELRGCTLALSSTRGVHAGGGGCVEPLGRWGAILQPLSEGTLREGGKSSSPSPL